MVTKIEIIHVYLWKDSNNYYVITTVDANLDYNIQAYYGDDINDVQDYLDAYEDENPGVTIQNLL